MTSHSITLEVTSVVSGIKERVSIVDERTPHAGIGAVTIVHHLQTVGVYLDAAIAITDPGWIDRGHLAGESPDVTCRCRATVVAQRVVVEAGIVHVSTDLQPFLSLIVSFQTSCKTLHITLLCDTLVLQVTYRSIEVCLVGRTGDRDIVFLAVTSTRTDILPVIRSNPIVLTIIVHQTPQGSIGVHLSILTDKHLSLRDSPDIVTYTTIGVITKQALVRLIPSLVSIHTITDQFVAIGSIMHLIIFVGTVDRLILLQGTSVPAILGIEGDSGLTTFTLLSGNHHYAIGTTGTIQSI